MEFEVLASAAREHWSAETTHFYHRTSEDLRQAFANQDAIRRGAEQEIADLL